MRYSTVLSTCLCMVFLWGCGNSQVAIQTAIAKTKSSLPTSTSTPTFSPTNTATQTLTPTATYTPLPTNTPKLGIFSNPVPIGVTVIRRFSEGVKRGDVFSMSLSVMEIKRGAEANQLAKTNLEWWMYEQPIENQEYLAAKIELDQLDGDPNEISQIFPYWSVTVRYQEGGDDTWAVNLYSSVSKDSYPPLTWSGWLFWLIREGTDPYIYFQPNLLLYDMKGLGSKNSGAYILP
jgi:hypothetical protein